MIAKIGESYLKDLYLLEPADEAAKKTMRLLSEKILEHFNFELDISAEIIEGRHYIELSIDASIEPLHYGYTVQNSNLTIFAGGAYSLKIAVQGVIDRILDLQDRTKPIFKNGETVKLNLLDNPDGLARPQAAGLRLMSCNILATFWDDDSPKEGIEFEMRTEIFKSYLRVFDPDVLGLQEVCNDWMACLKDICGDGKRWQVATGGGSRIYFVNPILYRADRYRLLDEGWINYSQGNSRAWGGRYMMWALFESVFTGERFALMNVHWSGWSLPLLNAVQSAETLAKLKELQDMYGCPVCITGDFNTRDFHPGLKRDAIVPTPEISDPDYTYLLADGTVKDAKFYTDNLVNDIGSIHAYGSAAYPRTYSFDHIFCTSDTTVRQFYTAWENQQQYATDHAWLIADIDLRANELP